METLKIEKQKKSFDSKPLLVAFAGCAMGNLLMIPVGIYFFQKFKRKISQATQDNVRSHLENCNKINLKLQKENLEKLQVSFDNKIKAFLEEKAIEIGLDAECEDLRSRLDKIEKRLGFFSSEIKNLSKMINGLLSIQVHFARP